MELLIKILVVIITIIKCLIFWKSMLLPDSVFKLIFMAVQGFTIFIDITCIHSFGITIMDTLLMLAIMCSPSLLLKPLYVGSLVLGFLTMVGRLFV